MSDDHDRRAHPRRVVCVAAEVASKGGQLLALIHDVSDDGALLYTQAPFTTGEPLDMDMRLSADRSVPTLSVAGRVVRTERMDPDRAGVWQWLVGVKFDRPLSPDDKQRLEQIRTPSRPG